MIMSGRRIFFRKGQNKEILLNVSIMYLKSEISWWETGGYKRPLFRAPMVTIPIIFI